MLPLPCACVSSSHLPAVTQNLGAPMLEKAFDGWNSTIFAYGQTGSGKSFSMTGSASLPGIIPQLNGEMFQRITASQAQQPEKKFLVTCSFMEIYNEVSPAARRRPVRQARWRRWSVTLSVPPAGAVRSVGPVDWEGL